MSVVHLADLEVRAGHEQHAAHEVSCRDAPGPETLPGKQQTSALYGLAAGERVDITGATFPRFQGAEPSAHLVPLPPVMQAC